MKKRVAIAISGGVDSLVAASLLKQEYPDLFGIHFITGYGTDENGNENQPEDIDNLSKKLDIRCAGKNLGAKKEADLKNLQKQLDIPIYCVDLQDVFEKEVVSYFMETYQCGKTPNPCLICNKKIKFGALYTAARNLGADLLATGHYAKIDFSESNSSDRSPEVMLLKGTDMVKDQSYFLSMLSIEQLRHAIFPLGDLTKQEVIAIAAAKGLVPTEKKESQDICFIHENSFADFITSKCKMPFLPGEIVNTDNKVVGTHKGVHRYTVGQRRGLNCPGPAPYYVKTIDMEQNRIIVGFKHELFKKECLVKDLNWLCDNDRLLTESLKVTTRIRYSHKGAPSTVISSNNTDFLNSAEYVKVIFDEPQLAVTPGQGAVFYHDNKVLGSGLIQ